MQSDDAEHETVVTTKSGPSPIDTGPTLEAGERIGRYLLIGEIGQGGMGRVVEAYDSKLDRRVALKLLRRDRDHPEAADRLMIEAQALARLQHPGVISVFEVGRFEGQAFISMELVDGRTFRRWLKEEKPPWREALRICVQAGRGLAAAHEAGLVHRDFKPGNVLVGNDGRVRVVDFGIATAASLVGSVDLSRTRELAQPADLTETGFVMGTPAYMAPEQHRAGAVDARSDQFSFCVTLYEALYGVRPFTADSPGGLAQAKHRGEIREPPPGVPKRVRDVLWRGLSPDPLDRWPTLGPLLDALEAGSHPRRSWLWIGGLLVVGAAAASLGQDERPATCDAGTGLVGAIWNESRRESLSAAFESSEVVYALDVGGRVEGWLNIYSERWADAHAEVCRATLVEAAVPEDVFDARMACLRLRLEEMDELIAVLEEADDAVVRQATQAAAGLTSPADCANEMPGRMEETLDPESARSAEEIRRGVARARAHEAAGKFESGLDAAWEVYEDARRRGPRSVEVESGVILGRLLSRSGKLEEAERILTTVAHDATSLRHDIVAAEAASHLTYVVGYQLARHEDGLKWGRFATAAAERANATPLLHATIASNVASGYFAHTDYEKALVEFARVVEIRERHLGPDHPNLGSALSNLASLLIEVERFDEAEVTLGRALAIWEKQLGPQHPVVATGLTSLGVLYERRREYAKAVPLLERALAIREQILGPEHVEVATPLDNLGSLLMYLGRLDAAEERLLRAKSIREAQLPVHHPHRASSWTNLGMLRERQGRWEEARRAQRNAIEAWTATVGENHSNTAYSLTSLGIAELELGRTDEAVEVLQHAVEIRMAAPRMPRHLLGRSRLALGRALEAQGTREPACVEARAAAEDYAAAQDDASEQDARRWLESHCTP